MTLTNEERWLPVSGYEGLYEVSDLGNVRSLRKFVLHKEGRPFSVEEGTLHPCLDRDGYPTVILCKDGREWVHRVHRLVMKSFVGPRPEGKCVRHRNGYRLDNRLDNLTYGSPKQNGEDKSKHGTIAGENHPAAKLTNEQIEEIRRRLADGKWGIVSQLAREYGVTHTMISYIKNGKSWSHLESNVKIVPKHIMSEDTVREIKERIVQEGDSCNLSQIARDYGVSPKTISALNRGEIWTHITLDDAATS